MTVDTGRLQAPVDENFKKALIINHKPLAFMHNLGAVAIYTLF